MNTAGNMRIFPLFDARSRESEALGKLALSCDSMPSEKGDSNVTIASGFRVDGRGVLLPLVSDVMLGFACTNRIARLARCQDGFTTSCSGPSTRVQITMTALLDPLMASSALLRAREKLMWLSESVSYVETIRYGNIEIYASDPTRDTRLAAHLSFEWREGGATHVIHAVSTTRLVALEKIVGGRAHMQLTMRRSFARWVQASVRLPMATLSCGAFSGRCVGERIVHLHQLTDTAPHSARSHIVCILRGIAPAITATSSAAATRSGEGTQE